MTYAKVRKDHTTYIENYSPKIENAHQGIFIDVFPIDNLSDKGYIGDYSYYNIGDRGTRSFQELRELFAGNGMVGYVAKERVDGKLVLPEAY